MFLFIELNSHVLELGGGEEKGWEETINKSVFSEFSFLLVLQLLPGGGGAERVGFSGGADQQRVA